MPYKVKKQGDKYVVYKKDTGKRVGATAGNKEALRKYMAALHINAKEGVVSEDSNQDFDTKLRGIFKQKYTGFVSALGKFASDPKFRQFVKDTDVSKSIVKLTSIPVAKLIPTQNEIDINKSLKFSLVKPQATEQVLKGGVVKIGAPIIVFNGKFIIDGHHRWSQLYAMDKDARILAYNFTNPEIKNPLDALKLTQVAIVAAGATRLPSNIVQSANLLDITEEPLKQYVIQATTDPAAEVFQKRKQLDTKESIADYVWSNVSAMQQTSQPVAGAPPRNVMPQADEVPGGQKNTIAQLQQGVPSLAEQELRKLVRREVAKFLRK